MARRSRPFILLALAVVSGGAAASPFRSPSEVHGKLEPLSHGPLRTQLVSLQLDEGVIWVRANFPEGTSLEQTAELAADLAQVLNLSTILDRAISRRLSTRARFQHTGSTDYYALARAALRSLAFESLGLNRVSTEDPQRLTLSQLTYAWRRRSPEPEAIFLEIISSTGLLLQDGEHWRFAAELVRDELAAEFMEAEGFLQVDQVLYPQVEQPIGFWAARLMRAGHAPRVVDLLTALRDLADDPYGARW